MHWGQIDVFTMNACTIYEQSYTIARMGAGKARPLEKGVALFGKTGTMKMLCRKSATT